MDKAIRQTSLYKAPTYRIKLIVDIEVDSYDAANNLSNRVYEVVEETLTSIGATYFLHQTEARKVMR